MIFIGTMFGVQEATSALMKMANTLAVHVGKRLARKALTKGMIYPIVKKVAKSIGAKMTKVIFADGVASAIPIVGSLASGGLTFALFRPQCMRLRRHLSSFNLSNPDYYRNDTVQEG